MSLPAREPTQEERIRQRVLIVQTVPDLALLYETARMLGRLADAWHWAGDEEHAIECFSQRLKIEKHLGILWDWREDIRVPRPDEAPAQQEGVA
jgi:hypothetical protein